MDGGSITVMIPVNQLMINGTVQNVRCAVDAEEVGTAPTVAQRWIYKMTI